MRKEQYLLTPVIVIPILLFVVGCKSLGHTVNISDCLSNHSGKGWSVRATLRGKKETEDFFL